MLELLRILLCGIGVVYLVIRFARFARSLVRGYALWPPAYGPTEDRGPKGRHGTVTPVREKATVPSSRASG
jgi:hypothetical protein